MSVWYHNALAIVCVSTQERESGSSPLLQHLVKFRAIMHSIKRLHRLFLRAKTVVWLSLPYKRLHRQITRHCDDISMYIEWINLQNDSKININNWWGKLRWKLDVSLWRNYDYHVWRDYDFCKFKITCLSDRRESKATPISVFNNSLYPHEVQFLAYFYISLSSSVITTYTKASTCSNFCTDGRTEWERRGDRGTEQ